MSTWLYWAPYAPEPIGRGKNRSNSSDSRDQFP